MSLILDALRRSENGGAATSAHPSLPEHHSGGMEKKCLGIGFVVVAGLGIAAGWMMRGDSTDLVKTEPIASLVSGSLSSGDGGASLKPPRAEAAPSARVAELSASAPPASTTGASGAAPTQDKGTADAAEADTERIAALHQQMWSDVASLSEGEGIGSDQNGAPNLAAEKPDEPARPEEVSAAASSSAPSDAPSIAPPIDLVAAIERAAREVGEPNLVPHPTVLLENLSQQQKDEIPTIVYSEHVYAEGAAPSVELNGQRLRPGQRAGAITVEDILVDSVILRVNGVSFRLRALNTWVNL